MPVKLGLLKFPVSEGKSDGHLRNLGASAADNWPRLAIMKTIQRGEKLLSPSFFICVWLGFGNIEVKQAKAPRKMDGSL